MGSFRILLKESVKVITTATTAITFHSYWMTLEDRKTKDTRIASLKRVEENLDKKANTKDEALAEFFQQRTLSEVSETLEKFQNQITATVDKMNGIDENSSGTPALAKECSQELLQTAKETLKKLEDITPKNKFMGDDGYLKELLDAWRDFLSTLNFEQLGAVFHISASILILLCLFTVITILYSDLIIKYFNWEEKYPKLAGFIKVRRRLQHFSLFINFLFIFITLFAIIAINFKVLF